MSSNLIVNNIEVGAGATIYTAASNTLTFGTNGSEKVRIASDGKATFAGVIDAQGYINLAQKIIHTGDADTSIEFPSNDTIKFETAGGERLRINSSGHLGVGDNNPDTRLSVTAASGTDVVGKFTSTDAKAWIQFRDNSTTDTGVMIGAEGDDMMLRAGSNERLRIASDGDVIIGGADAGYPNFADNLTIHDTQHSGITIRSGIASQGAVYFSDATGSGAGTYVGNIIYDHSDNHMRFATSGTERVRITSGGKVGMGLVDSGGTGCDPDGNTLLIRAASTVGTTKGHIMLTGDGATNGEGPQIVFSESGGGSNFAGAYIGHIRATTNSVGHLVFGTRATGGDANTIPTERLRITSDGVIQTPGTTKIKPHSVGIGTTATTNTGVGTAYGEMMYNTTDDKLQIYTKSNKWYNVHNWTDSVEGYYKSTTDASADGLNHYWPGNSSNSLISNLVPNNTSNSPVINLTVDSYHGTYPYFNFYSGNNELGWRFTKGGTKWGNGPFTIAFWVRPQASNLESESTFVQLGSHSGLRSLYTVSTDASRQLKAITIGDDTGVHSSATLSTGWQHVVVTYETNRNTKYYINGSNVRTFNHSSNLDVGTSTQYIYIGYGHWNSSSSNKASMSQMSDIGIWDSDALTATEISNLYNAKRIIAGY